MSINTENTEITQIDSAELSKLLDMGGNETSVMESPNPFKKPETEDNFSVNVSKVKEQETSTTEQSEESKNTATNTSSILDDVSILEQTEQESSETAKAKPEKIPVLSAMKDLIKDGVLYTFEEEEGKERSIEEYSKKELVELIQANINRVREEVEQKAPAEFFDSLSPQLQYLANYEANGGKDITKVLRHIAELQETQELDASSDAGQEQVIRAYYTATNFGSPEEIEEEVNSIKDRNELEKKANQFKPKLEAKKQEKLDRELKVQENIRKQKEAADVKYREAVYGTLAVGDLEGIKLNETQQGLIYNGLVNGVEGIRELLKNMPDVKPTLPQLAKVYWHLKDPKGFEDALKASTIKEVNAETVKKLKSAANEKTTAIKTDVISQSQSQRTIQKPKPNPFAIKRT